MTAIASCHCPTPGGPCPLSKTECSYRLSISQWLARSIAASSADAAELGVREALENGPLRLHDGPDAPDKTCPRGESHDNHPG